MFNPNGKRARDEQDDGIGHVHEQKRIHIQPLPFRTSPTIKHSRLFSQLKRNAPKPLFTQTITPTDSEDEISPQVASIPTCPQTQTKHSNPKSEAVPISMMSEEMDLSSPKPKAFYQQPDVDLMMLSPNPSPCSMLPSQISRLGTTEVNSGGRLPTPIYGHFQPNADGKKETVPQLTCPQPSPDEEYEKHMRARRLPTPISEDEAMDTFDSPDAEMMESPASDVQQPMRPGPRATFQPAKKGKLMFSMGFRADCEMCKARVPGHYNHIFRA